MISYPMLRRAFLVLTATLLLTSLSLGQKDDKKPLRWGADEEGGAPYIAKDTETGKYEGFEVDLANALSKELGRPIEFKPYEFKSLVNGLKRGDIDFAMNGLEVTPEREKEVRFSRPYYIYRLQLVGRKDAEFRTLQDLKKQKAKVGTLANTAAARLLERMKIETRIYDDQVNPYRDLAQNRLDAVLLDLPIAIYVVKKNDELNEQLKFVGEAIEPGKYAIAFERKDEELADQFDAALGRLIEKGVIKRIYEKWGLWNDDQKEFAPPPGTVPPPELEDVGVASSAVGPYQFLVDLLKATWVTIYLSVTSMGLAIALGLLLAVARLYGPAPLRWLALLYVELFRGVPVLLILVCIYYVFPILAKNLGLPWDLTLEPETAAIIGFGLNYAAFESEIYRTGISSVSVGQWEAASSLGMGPVLSFRRVILPQAMRVIIPPMTNDFVALFKDTSVASVIAVRELTKQYLILVNNPSNYSLYLEFAALTAALYLMLSVPLSHLARNLEKRWAEGHV